MASYQHIRGRHREVVAIAELSEASTPGVVSLPYGWGHGRPGARQHKAAGEPGVSINALTDEQEVDPLSGTAVFNGVAVELSPVPPTDGMESDRSQVPRSQKTREMTNPPEGTQLAR